MAKKPAKRPSKKAAPPDGELADAFKGSARQIWLAGLGAFAKAQAEGGKVFEALVQEGVGLQRKTRALAEERLGDVAGKVGKAASEAAGRAGASWDRLEGIFEERTARALAKLGVPTAPELAELARRVEALEAARPGAPRPAKKAVARKAPMKKAAAKKSPARKKKPASQPPAP
jgi:poly(hydroxyalkanoate) granule-associated protein